jgi:two-component system cell cycle sensor histidine kinase/response regulator CckA
MTPKPMTPRPVQTGAGTILFVDDEAMIRASGMRMLETLGYQVLLAENGRVAIDLYQRNREAISLVILDLVMPVMDGPETFHRLKELDPGVRILLTSGYTREWNIDPLLVGAAGFIPKPYDIEQLSEKLYQALDSRATPQA